MSIIYTMPAWWQNILQIIHNIMPVIYTILIFGTIIFIHELGHFIVAKLCKVTIHEFSLGMGPTLLKKQGKVTKYSLRLLPIGGYVAMAGEDGETDDPNSLKKKPKWQRVLILLAGATMNLILGFIILLCIYSSHPVYNSTIVAQFAPNATTEATGLQVGDEIVKMNKTTIVSDQDIILEIYRDSDSKIDMKVIRDGEKISLPGVQFDTSGQGAEKKMNLDFSVQGVERSVFSAIDYTFRNSFSLARNSVTSIGDLFTGTVKFDELSGPVGVGEVVHQASGMGFESVMRLVALITISIGMFNLLPFPALDGGQIAIIIIELIIRRPINPKVEAAINGVGLIFLLGLMIVITFKDIINLF